MRLRIVVAIVFAIVQQSIFLSALSRNDVDVISGGLSSNTGTISHHNTGSWEQRRIQSIDERRGSFSDSYSAGMDSCPCLSMDDERLGSPLQVDDSVSAFFGSTFNFTTYGIGCATHDAAAQICLDGCSGGGTITPIPIDCDRSWCQRNWCWVDPIRCSLLNTRSRMFGTSNRFYSYATCLDMDSFTQNTRLGSLDGRVLRAGFNSNSGGWIGAYSSKGESFEGPVTRWSGPIVSFLVEAARAGNFRLNLTIPPEFLQGHSLDYFGSSKFDFCVYSTALGYLDLCIAQYTVTDDRAATAEWLVLGTQELHLIVSSAETTGSGWQRFAEATGTIFAPFTQSTWLFVIIFVIPVLGALMVVHEYGKAGSGFPIMESVIEVEHPNGDRNDGSCQEPERNTRQEVKDRRVPICRHIVRSIYIGFLSVLQQNYGHSVVTHGAMLNLLGVSFFILTFIAVYTANLAAILTQKPAFGKVSGIEEALRLGYRLCSERKNMEVVRSLYGNITTDSDFVVDPVELGGDGKPGFTCVNCKARRRVFAQLDPVRAASDPSFCHAAIVPIEDLEEKQQNGLFCNLTIAGDSVGDAQIGIPVYSGVSAAVISLLLKLKNDGAYDKELLAAHPLSVCAVDEGGEGSALSIEQLAGIWVVSFGFAVVGLIVRYLSPQIARCRKKQIIPVVGYDQTGKRINLLERDDSWIKNKIVIIDSKPVFVGVDESNRQGSSVLLLPSVRTNPRTTSSRQHNSRQQSNSRLGTKLGLSLRKAAASMRIRQMDEQEGNEVDTTIAGNRVRNASSRKNHDA